MPHPPHQPRPERPSLSCILPAYNEAANLPLLLDRLAPVLDGLSDAWEVIVVDDGSVDDTAQALLPWLVRPGVRYLRLSRNFGKEAALTAGIDHARGEVVLLMDADLQHPASLVADMVAAWRRGADMVCAARASRSDESVAKRLGTWAFYRLVNTRHARVRIPVDAGDFRLMDRRVVQALRALPERTRFMKGLYAWVGFRTEIVDYMPEERHAGASSFSLRRLAGLAFTGVTAFSTLPLRLWSAVGGLVALFALGFAGWIVVEHFAFGHDVPGWATIVTSVMLFSGVQLLSIGILGEYIGRIFDEVKRRPIYVVAAEHGESRLPPPAKPGPHDPAMSGLPALPGR